MTQFPKPPIWPPRTVFTEPLTAAPAAGAAYTTSPVSSSAPGDPFPETAATTRVDDEHVLRDFVNSKRNKNTNKKTEQNVKRFREWLAQEPRCEGRDFIDIQPVDMDRYVGVFLLELKKPNNTDYEPDTLTSFHRSINRRLEEIGYGYSLVDSKEFKLSKKVLESRRRDLKQKGLGNRPNVAHPLSKNDEEKLWETKQFGSETPQSLINTVWYFNAKLFGFCGVHESRQLMWGDLTLKAGENGEEFIEFNERETKTRTGNSTHLRPFAPKMFVNHKKPLRCPVSAYKQYRSHRPQAMLTADSPFYLGVIQDPGNSDVWYRSQPMGHDKLSSLIKRMAINAKLNGRFTNHSVRKTMITELMHSGIADSNVIQLSGHKSVQSLQRYHVASYDQQKEMSTILSGSKSKKQLAIDMPGQVASAAAGGPLALPATPHVQPERAIEHIQGTASQSTSVELCQRHGEPMSISMSRAHQSLSGMFAGAVFNGPVNIVLK